MSAGHQRGPKYDTGDALATMDVPMTDHATDRYHERLPHDAVRPPVAWRRGEDVEHPTVVATYNADRDPSRVRVYNHDDRYFVIFVCLEDRDPHSPHDEIVATVYALNTHEHGPTRCYLAAHGPHYREESGGR